ncbi:hypothetical protein HPC49_29640 [Pyxidicoccus fallax]|uniref:Lipoprotein n=1 Tax=Pyxidicoccus fallax TaxID=394095 RepID=A0A848LUY1_9BACT|nr:hypothetical protein [Pyxidicoccus fallax]NMO21283.1 hypothetical protein [Pyxidicoccus fallax]NPC82371.1 hypothetical protein [Pyxidicoccus fallax]
MPSSLRCLGAVALLLLSGACARAKRSPEEGWPAKLDFSRLPRRALDQEGSSANVLEMQQRGEAYARGYRQRGPFHGTSHEVTVFYVLASNEFYLQENCMMGHWDPPIGPFAGDPREVLAPASP